MPNNLHYETLSESRTAGRRSELANTALTALKIHRTELDIQAIELDAELSTADLEVHEVAVNCVDVADEALDHMPPDQKTFDERVIRAIKQQISEMSDLGRLGKFFFKQHAALHYRTAQEKATSRA